MWPCLRVAVWWVVTKAGKPQTAEHYFSVQINREKDFEKFSALVTTIITRGNQSLDDKYRKRLVSNQYYRSHYNSTPQRVSFQGHPAFTYESATTKLLFVSLNAKIVRLMIDKQDSLGNQISTTFKHDTGVPRDHGTTVPVVKREIARRHPFDVYVDQLRALKKFSMEEKLAGQLGSESAMVREAIDAYIEKRRKK